MTKRRRKNGLVWTVIAFTCLKASSFAPSITTRPNLFVKHSTKIRRNQIVEAEDAGFSLQESYNNSRKALQLPPPSPMPPLSVQEVPLITSSDTKERRIILPPTFVTASSESPPNPLKRGKTGLSPGTKFRASLALATVACLSLTSWLFKSRWITLMTTWFSHRGFQGLSSLGRTVAYGWALLVAYPNLLDRKASERKQRERERYLERRRAELYQLAAEVSRLSQDLSNIDAEIRAFRREIISLSAFASGTETDNSKSVRDAIGAEMAHLAQLRSDAQAALSAARQTWAEARAQSPPEAWPRSMPPH